MKVVEVILIVIGILFIITFTTYITNADGKLVEKIYNEFIKMHDKKEVNEKI